MWVDWALCLSIVDGRRSCFGVLPVIKAEKKPHGGLHFSQPLVGPGSSKEPEPEHSDHNDNFRGKGRQYSHSQHWGTVAFYGKRDNGCCRILNARLEPFSLGADGQIHSSEPFTASWYNIVIWAPISPISKIVHSLRRLWHAYHILGQILQHWYFLWKETLSSVLFFFWKDTDSGDTMEPFSSGSSWPVHYTQSIFASDLSHRKQGRECCLAGEHPPL